MPERNDPLRNFGNLTMVPSDGQPNLPLAFSAARSGLEIGGLPDSRAAEFTAASYNLQLRGGNLGPQQAAPAMTAQATPAPTAKQAFSPA